MPKTNVTPIRSTVNQPLESYFDSRQRDAYTIESLLACVIEAAEREPENEDVSQSLRHIHHMVHDLSIALDSVNVRKAGEVQS